MRKKTVANLVGGTPAFLGKKKDSGQLRNCHPVGGSLSTGMGGILYSGISGSV
jgi:hypothetical protein